MATTTAHRPLTAVMTAEEYGDWAIAHPKALKYGFTALVREKLVEHEVTPAMLVERLEGCRDRFIATLSECGLGIVSIMALEDEVVRLAVRIAEEKVNAISRPPSRSASSKKKQKTCGDGEDSEIEVTRVKKGRTSYAPPTQTVTTVHSLLITNPEADRGKFLSLLNCRKAPQKDNDKEEKKPPPAAKLPLGGESFTLAKANDSNGMPWLLEDDKSIARRAKMVALYGLTIKSYDGAGAKATNIRVHVANAKEFVAAARAVLKASLPDSPMFDEDKQLKVSSGRHIGTLVKSMKSCERRSRLSAYDAFEEEKAKFESEEEIEGEHAELIDEAKKNTREALASVCARRAAIDPFAEDTEREALNREEKRVLIHGKEAVEKIELDKEKALRTWTSACEALEMMESPRRPPQDFNNDSRVYGKAAAMHMSDAKKERKLAARASRAATTGESFIVRASDSSSDDDSSSDVSAGDVGDTRSVDAPESASKSPEATHASPAPLAPAAAAPSRRRCSAPDGLFEDATDFVVDEDGVVVLATDRLYPLASRAAAPSSPHPTADAAPAAVVTLAVGVAVTWNDMAGTIIGYAADDHEWFVNLGNGATLAVAGAQLKVQSKALARAGDAADDDTDEAMADKVTDVSNPETSAAMADEAMADAAMANSAASAAAAAVAADDDDDEPASASSSASNKPAAAEPAPTTDKDKPSSTEVGDDWAAACGF